MPLSTFNSLSPLSPSLLLSPLSFSLLPFLFLLHSAAAPSSPKLTSRYSFPLLLRSLTKTLCLNFSLPQNLDSRRRQKLPPPLCLENLPKEEEKNNPIWPEKYQLGVLLLLHGQRQGGGLRDRELFQATLPPSITPLLSSL